MSAMTEPSPLAMLRRRLALAVAENAVFDGWTPAAVESAARRIGVDPVPARLAMPTAFVIDTKGRIVETYVGRIPPEAWDRIAELLP